MLSWQPYSVSDAALASLVVLTLKYAVGIWLNARKSKANLLSENRTTFSKSEADFVLTETLFRQRKPLSLLFIKIAHWNQMVFTTSSDRLVCFATVISASCCSYRESIAQNLKVDFPSAWPSSGTLSSGAGINSSYTRLRLSLAAITRPLTIYGIGRSSYCSASSRHRWASCALGCHFHRHVAHVL